MLLLGAYSSFRFPVSHRTPAQAPHRRRLKILARMSAHDLKAKADLAAPGYRGLAERGFTLRLHAFDWNCPDNITPRFTADEIEAAIAPLRARLRDLGSRERALAR